MPYFTLNYASTSSKENFLQFIVLESYDVLSNIKIASISKLIKQIIERRLICISVPTTFPLTSELHNNTLAILHDVLSSMLTLAKKLHLPNKTTFFIKQIRRSIVLSSLQSDLSLFDQPLPVATDSNNQTTPNWKRTTSSSEISPLAKKPRLSPTETTLSLNDQEFAENNIEEAHLLIEEDATTDLWITQALACNPLENIPLANEELLDFPEDLPLDILENPSNTLPTIPDESFIYLPVIEILEKQKFFILKEQVVTDIAGYMNHLHNGINFVLENDINVFDPSETISKSHSPIYLRHQSLYSLLSLLKKQEPQLSLIKNDEDRESAQAEHVALFDAISNHLTKEGVSLAFINKALSMSSFVSLPNTSEINHNSKLIDLSSFDLALTNTDSCIDDHESTPSSKQLFITLNITSKNVCIASLSLTHQRLFNFLQKINKLIKKGSGYKCLDIIEGIPLKESNSRAELLKFLYVIVQKNSNACLMNRYLYPASISKIAFLLNTINKHFCEETKESFNPYTHSKILTACIPSNLNLPLDEKKDFCLPHYQIFLKLNEISLASLYIEEHTQKERCIQDLLKQKQRSMRAILLHLKHFLLQNKVVIKVDCLSGHPANTIMTPIEILPSLYSLLLKNQYVFEKMFSLNYSAHPTYQSMMKLLKHGIDVIKTFAPTLVIPNLDYTSFERMTPFPSTESLELVKEVIFMMPFFTVYLRLGHFYHFYEILYTVKKYQTLKQMLYTTCVRAKDFKNKINLLLETREISIFYKKPKLNSRKKEIKEKAVLAKIIIQGLRENKYYLQKYYSKYNYIKNFEKTLKEIDDSLLLLTSSCQLPHNQKAPTLEKIYKDAQIRYKNKQEILIQQSKISPPSNTLKYSGPSTFLFTINLTHTNLKKNLHSYKIAYILKYSHKTQFSWLNLLRKTLTLHIQHMKNLCEKEITSYKVRYAHPFSEIISIIHSKDELLKLFYEGIRENMSFISEIFSNSTPNLANSQVIQEYNELLQIITTKFDGSPPELKDPYILKRMKELSEKEGAKASL
ncbi:hypothetical protein CLAVI_000936 [Candidatus Clavichlamydia salmonicola]|uniref:hypothetical protein n=1 Tax=Candidatus Clavichlamydia salmonicola TaxID=469812 RepID=UPI001891D10D|nr:hypothetical protein [Candidatus Clavichlamydia salmonicola]MBF5051295.1 hypothetical protein [Candidatus Clavichlamydia salmonicola]